MNLAWHGRVDLPATADTQRWHQRVALDPQPEAPGIALLGFASDEGIRRNAGRLGAAQGPGALRNALANLPVLHCAPLYDAGRSFEIASPISRALLGPQSLTVQTRPPSPRNSDPVPTAGAFSLQYLVARVHPRYHGHLREGRSRP